MCNPLNTFDKDFRHSVKRIVHYGIVSPLLHVQVYSLSPSYSRNPMCNNPHPFAFGGGGSGGGSDDDD